VGPVLVLLGKAALDAQRWPLRGRRGEVLALDDLGVAQAPQVFPLLVGISRPTQDADHDVGLLGALAAGVEKRRQQLVLAGAGDGQLGLPSGEIAGVDQLEGPLKADGKSRTWARAGAPKRAVMPS